jgi:hypothetical protein
MPCPHKFQEYLNLGNIDFIPTTLIVGTFNPAWPETNQAPWFYGRTENNNFWNVLPRLYDEESLINATPERWKQFCKRKKIAITDLISCINDANEEEPAHRELLSGYSDKAIADTFQNFELVPIAEILAQHDSIENVYLTRGTGETFWRRTWRPVKHYCQDTGKRIVELLTPSGYAYFQQGRYNNAHPEMRLDLPDFILMQWNRKWHHI